MDKPQTLEEAKEYRYGQWAGMPNGHRYQVGRCIRPVWGGPRGMMEYQCARKAVVDGIFCKQHAPKEQP